MGQPNREIPVLEGHRGNVKNALELSDGQILSWAEENTLRIWNNQTGECLAKSDAQFGPISGAFELSDGRILSWGEEAYNPDAGDTFFITLHIWNRQTKEWPIVLEGHWDRILGAF